MKRFWMQATLAATVAAALATSAHATLITDNFDANHDYTSGNVSGTIWSGVLNAGQLDPASGKGLNANTQTTGQLTLNNRGGASYIDGWERTGNTTGKANAPFLYLNVTGDFDAKVQTIPNISTGNYDVGGLLIRNPSGTGSIQTENFIQLALNNMVSGAVAKANGYRIVTSTGSAASYAANADVSGTGLQWLRITRIGNVYDLYRSNDGSTWGTALYTWNDTANKMSNTVQVGLTQGMYGTNAGTRYFDNFSITVVPEPGSFSLFAMAAVGFGLIRRRRRNASTVK